MSGLLCLQWTITPRIAPRPRLPCNRCGEVRSFSSSGKIRLNASGRRIDAWLIYNCVVCENRWNRPLLERRNVDDIEPATLQALQSNDPDWVRRAAFDVEGLKRRAARVEEFATVEIDKVIVSAGEAPLTRLEIRLIVRTSTPLRADRLLASELGCSRTRILSLSADGRLRLLPHGAQRLRRPVRDGTLVRVDGAADLVAAASAAHEGRKPISDRDNQKI